MTDMLATFWRFVGAPLIVFVPGLNRLVTLLTGIYRTSFAFLFLSHSHSTLYAQIADIGYSNYMKKLSTPEEIAILNEALDRAVAILNAQGKDVYTRKAFTNDVLTDRVLRRSRLNEVLISVSRRITVSVSECYRVWGDLSCTWESERDANIFRAIRDEAKLLRLPV